MGYISVIVLRFREPDLPRPYRTWGYPWTTPARARRLDCLLAGAIISDKRNSLIALGDSGGQHSDLFSRPDSSLIDESA